jgi:hypothetical protein
MPTTMKSFFGQPLAAPLALAAVEEPTSVGFRGIGVWWSERVARRLSYSGNCREVCRVASLLTVGLELTAGTPSANRLEEESVEP